jgi:hypothetical protein
MTARFVIVAALTVTSCYRTALCRVWSPLQSMGRPECASIVMFERMYTVAKAPSGRIAPSVIASETRCDKPDARACALL